MASFSGPKLSNRIADDVPAIQEILGSLAKLTPDSGNTDYPNGTKRVTETTNGYEFQQWNGSSWVHLEKWNINAQKVDGYSASTGTTASTIPVRGTDGKISGDITGNASTASTAAALSATNPIDKGGTGATSAADARTNLGTPPISHASSGTTYGVSSASNYGHAKASATSPKALGTAAVGSETSTFARGDHVHPTTTATDSVLGMVKLSDATNSTSAASAGIAASPAAVKSAMDKATSATTTASNAVPKTGSRGSLGGYETLTSSASAVTISNSSKDDTAVTGAVKITVNNGASGQVWTKTVGITNGSATISLGSSWKWAYGSTPTVSANSVLVLKWYGTFGLANLIPTTS